MISGPEVHIDRIDARWLGAADACLQPPEEERAARFLHPEHRDTWRAGRAWVRHHLAGALGTTPDSITFATDARDRPHVVGAPPGFDCNWSHSGPWMALAVSRGHAVGIDIEVVRPDFPIDEVASSVCTAGECDALAAARDEPARRRLFFRLWTAKEALMKATGLGVALDPLAIGVRLQNDRPCGYATHPRWKTGSREEGDWVAAWTWEGHS